MNPVTSSPQQTLNSSGLLNNPINVSANSGNSGGGVAGNLSQENAASGAGQTSKGGLAGLLPTVASLGAMGLGAFLAPETGGASLLLPALAGGLGAGFGKIGENAIDKQGLLNGVLGETASNAGAGLLGGLAGKAIAPILGKVVSPLADKLSTSALQAQFKGTLDAPTAKALSDMGITDARQVGDIAPLITQSNGALSSGVKSALGASADNGRGIDISGLDTIAKNALAENDSSDSTLNTVGKKLTSTINNIVNPKGTAPENILTVAGKKGPVYAYEPGALQNALPEDVFKASQNMDKYASNAFNKAYDNVGNITNEEAYNRGQVYSKLADELESRAFGTNTNTPLELTDDAKQSIINELAPVKDINENVYNHYVNRVQNAKTVQELRPLQSSMVNASKALESTQRIAAKGGGLSGSDIARGAVGLATNPVKAAAGIIFNQPVTDRAASSSMGKLASITGKAAASKIVPTLARAGAIAANPVNIENLIPPAAGQAVSPTNVSTQQGAAMNPAQNPLSSEYNLLFGNASAPGASITPGYSSMLSGLTSLAPTLQKYNMIAPSLANLEGAYSNAGGAQGPLGGILTNLTGLLSGTPANAYQRQQAATSALLSSLLGINQGQASQLTPTFTQSSASAAAPLSNVNSLLGLTGGY